MTGNKHALKESQAYPQGFGVALCMLYEFYKPELAQAMLDPEKVQLDVATLASLTEGSSWADAGVDELGL